ncbi:MAG: amidohydrolase family protein [Candidatus Glassbacteria bacterium]|nr:amidohydrolase family protein [Candidatus Glassbacteria bacterium]
MRSKHSALLPGTGISSLIVLAAMFSVITGCASPQAPPQKGLESMTVEELAGMPKIDAHAHIMEFGDSGEADFIALLKKHNMKWLDICTIGTEWQKLRDQVSLALRFHGRYPDRLAWATSFNLENWGDPEWESSALREIGDGFDRGAVAVKVWKEIGMVLRDPDSGFVMIDDPRFGPVLDFIESRGKTLVAHIGEPRNCWLPLDSMTTEGDRSYYRDFPQYHGYLLPEIPGYWEQVDSRDRMLAGHPGLRVVGCHLGSLEFDVDLLAGRLDKYPNFAVDLAGRVCHFQVQDREKVRSFIIGYQDRLLYGTDNLIGETTGSLQGQLDRMDRVYRLDYSYFATDDELEVPEVREGFQVRGLALPAAVLRKIYYENALRWYPGI